MNSTTNFAAVSVYQQWAGAGGEKPPIIITAPNTVDHGHVLVHAGQLCMMMEQTVKVEFQVNMVDVESINGGLPKETFTPHVVTHTILWDNYKKIAVPWDVLVRKGSLISTTERG